MATETYLNKLVELAKGGMEPGHVQQLIGKARGHAGGKASGAARKMLKCDHEFGEGDTCEKCGYKKPMGASEFFSDAQHRLFIELDGKGLTDWIQVTPGPGRWSHSKYGAVEVDEKRLENYKRNFDEQVYQAHIPIDAEHQTKLSGALGYYREMKIGHNGKSGIWAKIEPTERGQKLLDEGGFRYFSPEFYDEWTDPATGKTYKDVITGGAFTTRPFFKDKSLQPVVMSELAEDSGETGNVFEAMAEAGFSDVQMAEAFDAAAQLVKAMEPTTHSEERNVTDKKTADNEKPEDGDDGKGGDTPTQASEDMIRQLSEERAKRETLEGQVKSMTEQQKQLSEHIEAMHAENRRRVFTETVTGRGGANDGGPQWFGEVGDHVKMLESLTKAFGEDSDEVKAYIAQQNATAAAITASKAFSEVGSTSPMQHSEPVGKLNAAVKQLMEKDASLSETKAIAKALSENPQLYAEYDREFMKKSQ